MKNMLMILLITILNFTHALSQSLEEKRSYYDIYTRNHLREIWTVRAGTAEKHGTYKEYDRQGGLIQQAEYRNNKLNGERKRYYLAYQHSTGALRLHQIFKDDELIEETSYFENGSKNYHKVVSGTWTYWRKDGSIGMKATVYPGEQWDTSWDVSASDTDAPKGDDLYILKGSGKLVKVKDIKFYLEGKLVAENYFNPDGLSIKNINYDLEGRKTAEWSEESGLYTQVLYYNETDISALSQQFIVRRKPNAGFTQHYETINHGKYRVWDEGGNLLNEGKYSDGTKIGAWKIFYKEDFSTEVDFPSEASYYREITFDQQRQPQGMVRDYYISGQLQFEGRLLSVNPDVNDEECKWYDENGRLKTMTNFSNGKEHGKSISYFKNGKPEQITNFDNGQAQAVKVYFETGPLSHEVVFRTAKPYEGAVNLIPVGDYKYYHENGEFSATGRHDHSNSPFKIGKWEYYDQSGKITKTEEYDHRGRLKEQPKPTYGKSNYQVQQIKFDLKNLRTRVEREYVVEDRLKSLALGGDQKKVKKKAIYNAMVKVYEDIFPKLDQMPDAESLSQAIRLKKLCNKVLELGAFSGSKTKNLENSLEGINDTERILQVFGL